MFSVLLLTFLWTCQTEQRTISELLCSPDHEYTIFEGEVIYTHTSGGTYESVVVVEKYYCAPLSTELAYDTVYISTGSVDWGPGSPLDPKSKWIFFGRRSFERHYRAIACDVLSALYEDNYNRFSRWNAKLGRDEF